MHPSLEQLCDCIPVFRRIEKLLEERGITAEHIDFETCKISFYFRHRAFGPRFELRWIVGLDVMEDDPDATHAATSVELRERNEENNNATLCVSYDSTRDVWKTEEHGEFAHLPTPEERMLADICKADIDEDEAFAYIETMAVIFLKQTEPMS